MKINILVALNILTISISFAQNFEGKIIYSNTCISNIPEITSEGLSLLIGSSQEYIIKDNNYKSISNGTLFEWQLYINISGKQYVKATSSETIFCTDDKKQDNEIISVKLNKKRTKVLGYNCDELVVQYNTKVQKYYFNSEINIDSKLIENSKFIDWYGNLLKVNALPLKIVTESFVFTNETVATEILPLKIENKTFELPEGIKVEEN